MRRDMKRILRFQRKSPRPSTPCSRWERPTRSVVIRIRDMDTREVDLNFPAFRDLIWHLGTRYAMLEDGGMRMRRLPKHVLVTARFPFSIQRRSSWASLLAVTHLLMRKFTWMV